MRPLCNYCKKRPSAVNYKKGEKLIILNNVKHVYTMVKHMAFLLGTKQVIVLKMNVTSVGLKVQRNSLMFIMTDI